MSQLERQSLSAATTQWLIAKGYNPGDLNQPGENGDTALMKATREGVYAVVKELIDAGADVNARNSDLNNALWFACFGNHYDLINLLLAVNIVENNSLTLIYELIDDGLESYIIPGKSINGFIFLISCVYYRSSWKYQNRSMRYCLLDSGHHLGAVSASAFLHNKDIQLIFDFDKLALNSDLGFENKEFITACAVSGEVQDKKIRCLRLKVPFVCGTDYFEPNQFIEDAYQATAVEKSRQQKLEYPQFDLDKDKFYQTIWNRRSIRRFRKEPISQEDYLYIVQQLQQPIPTENYEQIEIYSVVHRVEGMTPGLYKGTYLVKTGNFNEKTGYLCINQAMSTTGCAYAKDSAVTLFFVSDYLNYQTAMQIAGFLGQRLYLASNYLGIQCSGIGAYYDDETQELLETNKDVLYGMVIGI